MRLPAGYRDDDGAGGGTRMEPSLGRRIPNSRARVWFSHGFD